MPPPEGIWPLNEETSWNLGRGPAGIQPSCATLTQCSCSSTKRYQSPRLQAHLQVRAPTRCRNSVLSFFLLRHRAAATLFFSRRLFLLSSSSSSCNETHKSRSEHQEGHGRMLGAPSSPDTSNTSNMVPSSPVTKYAAARTA